jgi:hypothetical protein
MPTRYLLIPADPEVDARNALPFTSYVEAVAHLNTEWTGWRFTGGWRGVPGLAGALCDGRSTGVVRPLAIGARPGQAGRLAVLMRLPSDPPPSSSPAADLH